MSERVLLEVSGVSHGELMAWLTRLPWTFTSEPADGPGEYVIHVAEMRDAMSVGDERFVSRDIFASLAASIECRIEHGDPVPIPRAAIVEPAPLVLGASRDIDQ